MIVRAHVARAACALSILLAACAAESSSNARPVLRSSSAQSEESDDDSLQSCVASAYAMPFCAGRDTAYLEDAACEDGETIEDIFFQVPGNLRADEGIPEAFALVARLSYGRSLSYGPVEDRYDPNTNVTYGFVPSLALCNLADGDVFQPTHVELGFRSEPTGAVTPLWILSVVSFPVTVVPSNVDCSEAEYDHASRVTWRGEPRTCTADVFWQDELESDAYNAYVGPREPGATYHAEPICYDRNAELRTCEDDDAISRVSFESTDTTLHGLFVKLREYIAYYQEDVYVSTLVVAQNLDGEMLYGEAVFSVRDESMLLDDRVRGFVPASRYKWRDVFPKLDEPILLWGILMGVPDTAADGAPRFFSMDYEAEDLVWVVWREYPREYLASRAP